MTAARRLSDAELKALCLPQPGDPRHLVIALGEAGQKEVSGFADNPRIVEYLKGTSYRPSSGVWHDEIFWCSAFIDWCMDRAGEPSTNSAGASSWLAWQDPATDPQRGDVAVKSRDGGNHVTLFIVAETIDGVPGFWGWGGNQANRVGLNWYPISAVRGFRRLHASSAPPPVTGGPPKPGDVGMAVLAFQEALKAKGFDPGPIDGKYGPRTEAAYQASLKGTPVPAPAGPVIRLAWDGKHADADKWTVHAMQEVEKSGLPDCFPADVKEFCPIYPALTRTQRIVFWVTMIAAMAKPESGFNPASEFQEPGGSAGPGTLSIGLLQVSVEDDAAYRLGLGLTRQGLHGALLNITVTVRIMDALVTKHNRIGGQQVIAGKNRWRGVSAYWSCLRAIKNGGPRKSFQEIKATLLALKF